MNFYLKVAELKENGFLGNLDSLFFNALYFEIL